MTLPSTSVNLLSDRKKLLRQRQLLVAKIQLTAGVVLAVYIAVMLVVIGFRAAVSAKLDKTEKAIKNETMKISQMSQREALYTVLQNKVILATDFLANRISLRKVFEQVVAMIPEGTQLVSFTVNDADRSVDVTLETESVYVMVELLNILEDKADTGEYARIAISGFSRSADGTYSMSSNLPIEKKRI